MPEPTQATLMLRVKVDDTLVWLPNAETLKGDALNRALTVQKVASQQDKDAAVAAQQQLTALMAQADFTEDRIVLPLLNLVNQAKEKVKEFKLPLIEESVRIGKLLAGKEKK